MTAATHSAQPTKRRKKSRNPASSSSWQPYLYLLPTFVILGTFVFYPIFDSFRLSLRRVAPFGGRPRSASDSTTTTRLLGQQRVLGQRQGVALLHVGDRPVGIILAVASPSCLSVPLRRCRGCTAR